MCYTFLIARCFPQPPSAGEWFCTPNMTAGNWRPIYQKSVKRKATALVKLKNLPLIADSVHEKKKNTVQFLVSCVSHLFTFLSAICVTNKLIQLMLGISTFVPRTHSSCITAIQRLDPNSLTSLSILQGLLSCTPIV